MKWCGSSAEVVQKRCGSGAEVVRKQCGSGVEAVWKRCGSGAEAVRKRCGSGAHGGQEYSKLRALAMGSYYTYIVGIIAGEVAVFDSQDPVVDDRSAGLCK